MESGSPEVVADAESKTEIAENLPLDEKIKAEWDGDVKIREEFRNNFSAYKAFRNAQERGQVRRR
jgi:hypothetical protein